MFATTYPNKVFDYMAASKPTVLAIDGVIRDVIEEAEAGVFVRPGDASALAEAIRAYREDPTMRDKHGSNGRRYVAEHFSREKQAGEMKRVLRSIGTATRVG
jgi:glycosyltransferase involved in cell wall biosynthesis